VARYSSARTVLVHRLQIWNEVVRVRVKLVPAADCSLRVQFASADSREVERSSLHSAD
jgi:hypothetical protein